METKERIIIGMFELDKNKASMPVPVGDELPDEQFEADSNGAIMPKNTETD